ncbi:hypothetical protein ACWCQ4_26420, partial [Streptomyces aureus]
YAIGALFMMVFGGVYTVIGYRLGEAPFSLPQGPDPEPAPGPDPEPAPGPDPEPAPGLGLRPGPVAVPVLDSGLLDRYTELRSETR